MIPGTFCPHDFDQACMACINAAIEQARHDGAVEARNELLGGISLAKTPLTLDECIIMYRDAVRRMRQAEAKAEQVRKEEREACAMIADRRTLQTNLEIAAAIRARKP